jgi:hypothetical protein
MSIYTYIHERDDRIGRYDNIFSFFLFLSLPIVNRSLSLARSLARVVEMTTTNGNEQQTVSITPSEIAKQISRL